MGEAVGESGDGMLVGVTVSETVSEAGDGAFVGETVGEAVGCGVDRRRGRWAWARPSV